MDLAATPARYILSAIIRMCELLIRVVDKAPGKIGASVAGDVIACCEDGHQWSAAEHAHPNWAIVQIPGLPAAAMDGYLHATTDLVGKVINKRAIGFDLNAALGVLLRRAKGPVRLDKPAIIDMLNGTNSRASVGKVGSA